MTSNKKMEFKEVSLNESVLDSDAYQKIAPTKRGVALLAVTTFCSRDVNLLRKRAEYMQFVGCQPSNDLVLIGDSDIDQNTLEEMAQMHNPFFKKVLTFRMGSSGGSQSWPQSVNKAFRQTVWLLNGFNKQKFVDTPYLGWLYFESDIIPLVPDFMHRLQKEYIVGWNQGKRFMGIVGDIRATSGQVIRCMNGAGVYPFGMRYYNDKMMLTENMPWDAAGLSGQNLKPVHVMGYDKYAMHFSTWEYKKVGERQFECIKRRHAGPEEQDKCTLTNQWIHHGCKDGTLHDLLMGGESESKVVTIDSVPVIPTPNSLESANAILLENALKKESEYSSKQIEKRKVADKVHMDEALKKKLILIDHAAGMKWQQLIGKYKIAPKVLKSILPSK